MASAPEPGRRYPVVLGSSFMTAQCRAMTVQYEFRSDTVNYEEAAALTIDGNKVAATFKNQKPSEKDIAFEGTKETWNGTNCVLLFDGQQYRLERLDKKVKLKMKEGHMAKRKLDSNGDFTVTKGSVETLLKRKRAAAKKEAASSSSSSSSSSSAPVSKPAAVRSEEPVVHAAEPAPFASREHAAHDDSDGSDSSASGSETGAGHGTGQTPAPGAAAATTPSPAPLSVSSLPRSSPMSALSGPGSALTSSSDDDDDDDDDDEGDN